MSDQALGERPRHDNGPSASATESRVDASRAVLAASADGVVVIGGGGAIRSGKAALAITAHELHNRLAAIGVLAHVLSDDQVTVGFAERAKIAGRIRELASRMQMFVCSPAVTAAADRAELTMMLTNYVENALTHGMPPIEILATQRDDSVVIQVTDRGPGVPHSFEPRLFERFARAREAAPKAAGIGLGLWIVRTLASANGGDAWYEPAEGGGSRFVLRIPAAPGVATGHRSGRSDDQRSGGRVSASPRLSARGRHRDPA